MSTFASPGDSIPAPGMELLFSTTLTSSATTITTGTLQTGYHDLVLSISAKTDRASTCGDYLLVAFNGDTDFANNYQIMVIDYRSNGTAVVGETANAAGGVGFITGTDPAPQPANPANFGGCRVRIFSHESTDRYKAWEAFTSQIQNELNCNRLRLQSGLWQNTAAVTSLTFSASTGSDFVAGTSIFIYGMK